MRQLRFKLYCWRQAWRKRRRLLFPSPAEVELVRILGGKYITISWVKDPRTGFPFTLIWDLGTVLKREGIQREVRAGAMYLDFGTVGLAYRRAVEVDGLLWHMDVVREQRRDEYLAARGWQVLHVRADEIYRQPERVQRRVLTFLAS